MNYKMTELQEVISINKIISIHYFEYMSDFRFPGESHNFWEFLCVDKGEVTIISDHETFILKRGDIIFHKPNEFHALSANGVVAPNLLVIGFECWDRPMKFFEEKILTLGESERNLLAHIIMEAKSCFTSELDDPYLEQLIASPAPAFGSSQMIKIHLEQLLIQLYRSFFLSRQVQNNIGNESDSDVIYNDIIAYFQRNVRQTLTIDKICKENLISSSHLKKMFRERHGTGVIEYFTSLKIDCAKQLIRNRQMNFTQIADYTGYTSVHYFSRQFKKETGMTPSEYMASIKRRTER